MRETGTEYVAVENRHKSIIRTSIVGIVTNVLLAAFKAFIGVVSNSIAITLDAVNNLSDALSSVITILGTVIAGKKPDAKHPMGYGRTEYLTSTIIAVLVMYAGVTALIESVKKIIHPETPNYTVPALIVVAVAVVVKILLGRYFQSQGKKLNSDSLVNSGVDATQDSFISLATLVGALIFVLTGLRLEAYLGAIISVIIIKSGIEMLMDALDDILGRRPDAELSRSVRKTIQENFPVQGAYDLLMHNYGPNQVVASVHVAVDDTTTAEQIDELAREITQKVMEETGVIITSVGIYSVNTKNPEAVRVQDVIHEVASEHEHCLQIHGVYVDTEKKTARYDMVLDFAAKDLQALYETISKEVQEALPEYTVNSVLDYDLSD